MRAPFPEPFFYAPELPPDAASILSGDEARHAYAVQRLRVGDALALFDGCGTVVRGTIAEIQPRARTVRIRVGERLLLPPPAPAITLYCALPKGDRQSVLLDMATQLGMSRFVPLRCARSVVEPRAPTPQRWARVCLEACKQSRRAYLPALGPPLTLDQAIEDARPSAMIVAHPGVGACAWHRINPEAARARALFVGPEGGFTDDEAARLVAAGATTVTLGERILRIETAAVVLLAAFNTAHP